MSTPLVSVLVATYNAMDILDVVGPIEVFSHARDPTSGARLFSVTLAGADPTPTNNYLTVKPDISYADALASLDRYDILLVPGAQRQFITALLEEGEGTPVVQLVQKFKGRAGDSGNGERIAPVLMSVCTGSWFLAHCGVFEGRECTTHFRYADEFQELLDRRSPGARYVRAPYVDSGCLGGDGVRVVSCGGITNGMDGALYVVERLFGKEVRLGAAQIMDFEELQRPGIGAE